MIGRRKLAAISSASAAAAAMALYYVFMPAWVIVVSSGEDESALPGIESRFRITDGDLAEFPRLKEAMMQADAHDPNWVPPLKAWRWEGARIVERFDMDSQYPPEYQAVLVYDNGGMKVYHVQVVFGYESLAQY